MNKLAANGSWKFAGNKDAYNLINKYFNSGFNFLSLATRKTAGGNGSSTQLQVVSDEDASNTKDITGSIKFTGPYT